MRRSAFRLALAALLLLATVGAAAARPLVERVEAVSITVADLERSVAFYAGVLDFVPEPTVEVSGEAYERLTGLSDLRVRAARMRLGDERVELTEYRSPRGRPVPDDSRSNDGWFQHIAIVVGDMARAHARLRQRGVRPISAGPQRLPDWNREAGGIRAFYFSDPDGHVLELLQFPPDKGAAKWRRPSQALFRGIDHTAIVVADTDASLGFYRDRLGLAVAGESENYGIEQERLNAVPGARLRITGLRAPSGPGIELLEYLAPRDGRRLPDDLRANDLAHWRTRFGVRGDTAESMGGDRPPSIWPQFIDLPGAPLGHRRALLVRDPDGHAVELVQYE